MPLMLTDLLDAARGSQPWKQPLCSGSILRSMLMLSELLLHYQVCWSSKWCEAQCHRSCKHIGYPTQKPDAKHESYVRN